MAIVDDVLDKKIIDAFGKLVHFVSMNIRYQGQVVWK